MSVFRTHGGRLDAAIAHFGGRREEWIDLSTGINPIAWKGEAAPEPDWTALPDPADRARLEAIAAAHFGVDPSLCLAVPGSEVGLRSLGVVLGRCRGLRLRPAPLTYGTYGMAFESAEPGQAGATVRVLANPNNPTGLLHTREEVLEVLEWQERENGWLIVDEAFVDCHPGVSVADAVEDGRNLVVTRSFGKFFGLAGVRLGFVLAPSDIRREIEALQGDWPVCAAGLAFGVAAYRDSGWIARTRADLAERAALLDEVLGGHGLRAEGSSPLFRLVCTEGAGDIFEALGRAHILVRPFEGHPHLLRFGLPDGEAALARLDWALARLPLRV